MGAGIYEFATIDRLAHTQEFNAAVFAREFVAAVERTLDLATDERTMLSWFSVALMNGYDKGTQDGTNE